MPAVCFRKKRKRRQKAEWIGIPARKIEVGSHIEMLEFGETGHEIMGDRPPGRKLTQNVHLKPLKFPNHVRAEASKIQGVCRIGVSRCAIGQLDLIEVPYSMLQNTLRQAAFKLAMSSYRSRSHWRNRDRAAGENETAVS